MKGKRRAAFWIVFIAAVGVITALPAWFPTGEETVEPVGHAKSSGIQPASFATTPSPPNGVIEGAGMEGVASTDLFAAKTWIVPPPPPPPAPPATPLPPPPPMAPPLPFKFMGRLDDGSTLKVFLQGGEKAYVVSVGDVIEGTYQVESIRPGQITLIYLPMNIAQTLSAGSPS